MSTPAITGKVQKVFISALSACACVSIGPTPSNVQVCLVSTTTNGQVDDGGRLAYKNNILAAAVTALANKLPITVNFDNNGGISDLTILA